MESTKNQEEREDNMLELIKKSEEKYRMLLELAPDAFFHGDVAGNFIEVNQSAIELTLYSREELLTMNMKNLFLKEDLKNNPLRYDLLELGEVIKNERDIVRKDGGFVTVEMNSKKMPDGSFQSFFRDRTERKRDELTIKENENKYRELVGNSPDAIVIYSENKIVFINNECLHLFSVSCEEELIGKSVIQFVHPDYREFVTERMKMALQGTFLPFAEEKLIKPNGSEIDVEIKAMPIMIGNKTAVQLIIRDITEAKLAEAYLNTKQRELADIIEFLPDATLGIDKNKRVIIWNKAIEEMTGIPASDMIGKGDYAYTIPFYGEPRSQLMDLIFEDNKEIIARYPYINRDGETLTSEFFCNTLYNNKGAWISAKVSPLHDVSGNIIGAIESLRDITVSKQAEESLKESEEKFRAVSEYSFNAICIINESGKIIWTNEAMVKMGGYSKEEIYAADTFAAFLAPESIEFVVDNFKHFIKAEEYIHYYEFYIVRADGEKRLCEKYMSHFRDCNGNLNLVISITDITERRLIEIALKESEDKYRTMIEYSNDLIWTLDIDGNFLFINDIALKTMGLIKEEWIGKSFVPAILKEDLPEIMDVFHKTINGVNCKYELRFKKADDTILCFSVNTSPIYISEKIQGIVSFARDITERKQTEEIIRQMGNHYQALIEKAPDGIVLLNAEGVFNYISPSAKRIFGYHETENLIGLNPAEYTHPDDLQLVLSEMTMIFKDPAYVPTLQYRFKDKTENWKWVETTFRNLLEDSSVKAIVLNFRDITERKQTEKALKEKMDDLQRFHNITVGRELTMIALKKEINDLLKKNGQKEKYKIIE